MSTFLGYDFSRWQGGINWGAVASNASFAFYKGGGGDDGLYVDSQFLNNHAGARAVGVNHGVYWFAGGTDPIAEADYFYQQCLTNLIPGEVVVLDAERGNAIDPNWALPFLNHLEGLIGFKPVIYMSQNVMLNHDWSSVAGQNYGLWLADWDGDPNAPVQMRYWSFCAWQQYTDTASCPGVGGHVDGDAFFAPDMSYFAKYGKQAAPVVVVTPAPTLPVPAPPVPEPVTTTSTTTTTTEAPVVSITSTTTQASPVTTLPPQKQSTAWLVAVWAFILIVIRKLQGK